MSIDTKSAHVTAVGANVFSDLGFEPGEAAELQARSKRIISDKVAIKEKLMAELALWINTENLKQADAAHILGITRPRVSDVINKKTPKFTIDALVDMLARTGKRVEFLIA
ncbi:helix-turn-helix domain-containing protein [Janthinobacterium sp. 64]|uniref:helix-turn-helix domain-containing protein n=1 Tax=Janthinobacterium sp. 64 TaxID=2035208 RepID=UPI000C2CE30A|nr:XRE family transcriptional regulator [Janthinobacterium sp. 64]PKB23750.1 Xre family transcriptional regulator [Janthinobacterium sp. 64]